MALKGFLQNRLLLFVTISMIVIIAGASIWMLVPRAQREELQLAPGEGGLVALLDGASVQVPPLALSAGGSVSIARVEYDMEDRERTFLFADDVYRIEMGGEALELPILISIPFDASKLPPGRIPDEIFAIYQDEQQVWHPADSYVDLDAGTVRVYSWHASLWSWTIEIGEAIGRGVGEALWGDCEFSVEDARELERRREQEFDLAVERVHDVLDQLEAETEEGLRTLARVIALGTLIEQAQSPPLTLIASLYHLIEGSFTLFETSVSSGEVIQAVIEMKTAADLWAQADAIRFAMEHPEAESMPPALLEALKGEMLCTLVRQGIDFLAGTAPTPAATSTITLTPTQASTSTPTATAAPAEECTGGNCRILEVNNPTGLPASIVIEGEVDYHFDVPPGDSLFSVEVGEYWFSIIFCGGARTSEGELELSYPSWGIGLPPGCQ